MTITERIFIEIAKRGISQKEFAKGIEETEKSVSYWKRGNTLTDAADRLSKISDYFGWSLDYLFTGEKSLNPISNLSDLSANERQLLEYFNQLPPQEQGRIIGRVELLAEYYYNSISHTEDNESTTDVEYKVIRLYDLPVSAGKGIPLISDYANAIKVKETTYTHNAVMAIRVSGDSMYPKFDTGDILLADDVPKVEVGAIGIFRINNEGFVKIFRGTYLESINKKYENIELNSSDEAYAIGNVIGVLNKDDILEYFDRADFNQ